MRAPEPAASRDSITSLPLPDGFSIDTDACQSLLQRISASIKGNGKFGRIPLPLRFDNDENEVAFVALMSLLNFTSGYRDRFREPARFVFGIHESVVFGALGMHMESWIMDQEKLSNANVQDVARLFDLPATEEKEIMPAVKQDGPSWCRPLLDRMLKVLSALSRVLAERGFDNLGQMLIAKHDSGFLGKERAGSPLSADGLVQRLVSCFSFLDDQVQSSGSTIQLHSRAQAVAATLRWALGARISELDLSNAEAMPGCSDGLLAGLLVREGVLKITSEDLQSKIFMQGLGVAMNSPEEVSCRLAVVKAIGQLATSEISPWSVCVWLWQQLDDAAANADLLTMQCADSMQY